MQCIKKSLPFPGWLYKSPRLLCIVGFVCFYLFGFAASVPQVAAAPLSGPGGRISDPVVRQVDIARPAVVRIITKIGARLTVHFDPGGQVATFPLSGDSYPIELSGSGSFISAHGDVLTADHVVNPPHDRSLTDAVYAEAAQDVADYVNTHLRPSQPFTGDIALAELQAGVFPSTPAYDQPSSEVYLSTSYAGKLSAARIRDLSARDHASVDRIEAQSSFDAMDVAIVHVTGMDDMPSIQLGDSSQVAEQDNLTVIGFPGLADVSTSPTNLLTSSINKLYVSAIKTTDTNAQVIQVGGNIEHGDSGGPVLDESGHIVGIVSFGLFDPNESGETRFLQASNSARTLIQAQGIDTAPGALQKSWAQALNDYASSTSGHWHKAFVELQTLMNSHPGFLGATSYLSYAQDQANSEQLPVSSTGPNPVLVIVLALIIVLALLGAVLFVVMKRRGQVAPAGAAQLASAPYSMYVPQPGGVQSAYAPPAASYPPVGYGAFTPGSAPDTYPPTPASYGDVAWHEQSTGQVPQTPQPSLDEVPASPVPVQAAQSAEHSLPTWAPVPQTPRPVSDPLPSSSQPASSIVVDTLTVEDVVQPQPAVHAEDNAATPAREDVPAMNGQPQDSLLPASSQGEEQTTLAQSLASPWSFSVPRRPSAPMPAVSREANQELAGSFSGVYSLIAPCGHANTPEVHYCRVCGQPVHLDGARDTTDISAP